VTFSKTGKDFFMNSKTASQFADDASKSANEAIDSTRNYAQNAVNAAGEKVRDLRREAEPAVEQIAARVQQAVQRGLEAASATSARAQRRLEEAADVTGKYISDQPVRSVLIAAAAGAAITALIVLASRSGQDDY
jgi:ElaB/YqjD/DUF883 family membrane-anchored ribosome-binding protein